MEVIIKKGEKYGRLTAIEFSHKNKKRVRFWLFRCDCGNEKIANIYSIKNGDIRSCGCLHKEEMSKLNYKHGMRGNRIYKSWAGMKQRCYNSNNPVYKHYGARRITVCDRWLDENGFINFYADMGNCPEGKSLDRIDNNGNYNKRNCKWSNQKQQNNNKRSNHLITHQGKTQNVTQWSEELGINRSAVYKKFVITTA